MNNFDWTKFTRRIAVKANLEDIYHAWTKADELEKWFLSISNFYDEANDIISKTTPVRKGCKYEWNWYLYDGTESGSIIEANGLDHLKFNFAGDCLVDIRLSTQEEYTIVELTQDNIPTDELSKQNIRLGCDAGWSFFLVNLKSDYEGGFDMRNKNPNFKGMVNS